MSERTDFLLNEDLDFPIQDTIIGGVIQPTPYGYSDEQHKYDITMSSNGSFKMSPLVAFDVNSYLNSEYQLQAALKSLKTEMGKDGYDVSSQAVSPSSDGMLILFDYIK